MFNGPIISDTELFDKIETGREAENFLKHTPTGKALSERALHDWKQAVADFEDLSISTIMSKPELVVTIKHRMDVARSFILWVNDSLRESDSAEAELNQRDMSDATID